MDDLARKLNNPHVSNAPGTSGLLNDAFRLECLLKMFLQIVNDKMNIFDIAYTFRKHNHKEGIKGAVEIIMESFGYCLVRAVELLKGGIMESGETGA